jgi:hypothetical protein
MKMNALDREKICRLCLSDTGVILPIFDGEVAERFPVPLPMKILACVSIEVSNFAHCENKIMVVLIINPNYSGFYVNDHSYLKLTAFERKCWKP